MEQVLLEEAQEQEEVWVEAAAPRPEVEWAEIVLEQVLVEIAYALIANCLYHIKWVFRAIA